MEQLGQASMKLGEAVYKDSEAPDGGMEGMDGMDGMAPGGPGEEGSDDEPQPDNVVDADFEELDDEDKNQRSN
jgi:molecular chaperone DnaK